MAWGASKSIEDLLKRLQSNDPALTSLHIFQGKKFDEEEAKNLANALRSNTHLTELYASGHELSKSALRSLSAAIGQHPSLRILCLGNSTLGSEGVISLAEGIASSSSLQQLDLESKDIGADGAASLANALEKGLQLKTLLLARNPLGDSGAAKLAQGVLSSSLAHLDLRDCGITGAGIASLTEAIASSSSLQVLRLDENPLGVEGVQAIAGALSSHSPLEELHISRSSIGDEGVSAIAQASMKSRLKHLDVNGCGITAEGARSLQDALTSGSPLLCLKLQDNSIEDEGAECLGKALAQGAALQELSLANNQIGAGAARLLQGSSQIKKLNLSESDLGDEGASQLSAMLTACVHTNLQELELLGCNIGHTGLSRLFQVLQGFAAPALEVLLLAGNPGVDHAEFSGEVDVLSITRTDLDVVWRGACDAPPTAVDGGPPRPVNTQNWADEPEATEN